MRKIAMLVILVLCLAPAALAENYAPIALDADEAYAMNLFLSNFTEVGVDEIDGRTSDRALVDFAHDHMWFNAYDSFEYGEYSGDNNCRVADDRIQEIIDAFFYEPMQADLFQTRFDYDGEYYYHCETGGWGSGGFAHVMSVCPLGHDRYYVSFAVFDNGDSWDNDVLDDDLQALLDVYSGPSAYGSAQIHAQDLSDRSSYRMISYALV